MLTLTRESRKTWGGVTARCYVDNECTRDRCLLFVGRLVTRNVRRRRCEGEGGMHTEDEESALGMSTASTSNAIFRQKWLAMMLWIVNVMTIDCMIRCVTNKVEIPLRCCFEVMKNFLENWFVPHLQNNNRNSNVALIWYQQMSSRDDCDVRSLLSIPSDTIL